MSNIAKLWDAVVAEIATKVPALKEVRQYRGEFEGKEKGSISIRTPGALVAITGTGTTTKLSDGRLKLHVAVAVAIIAEDRKKIIDTASAELAEEIVGVIHENRFPVDGVMTAKSDPDGISIMNYNSDETLGRGISVWGVGWEQSVIVGAPQFVEPPVGIEGEPGGVVSDGGGFSEPTIPE